MTDKEFNFEFSPIKNYYTGKSILITGATGLVGKVLLYKILKSIETIDKVYLIIREKENKSTSKRLNDLFERSNGLFDDIDLKNLDKIILVKANLTTIGMNLSKNDKESIIKNVSIVFHSAADVNFDANLKQQILINVGGTKEIIDLCAQLKHLDALVYVSTVYSSPLEMVVTEKVYKSNKNPLDVLKIARNSMKIMNQNEYLDKYPNTYSYTKNLSENLIEEAFNRNRLPVTIVRPGVVLNTVREPISSWFDSITSIMGIFALLSTGLVMCLNVEKRIKIDIIPVDTVTNTCIASAHALGTKNKKKLLIYNCNSTCLGALSYGEFIDMLLKYMKNYPMMYTIRPLSKILTNDYFLCNWFTRFVTETCFAHFIDLIMLFSGQKTDAVKKVRFYHVMMKVIQPYIGRQWYFTNQNMIKLSKELSECDRNTFDCDILSINWNKYVKNFYFNSRKLLFMEKDRDIERAQRNVK